MSTNEHASSDGLATETPASSSMPTPEVQESSLASSELRPEQMTISQKREAVKKLIEQSQQPQEEEPAPEALEQPQEAPQQAIGEPEAPGGPEEQEPPQEPEIKPLALKDFAKEKGFDVKDLYGLEVPMGQGFEGDPVTFGELKDFLPKFQEAEAEIAERYTDLAGQKAQLMAAQRELALLQQESGVEITPDKLERIRSIRQAHLDREHNLFLSAVPELRDQATFQAWQGKLAEKLPKYGIRLDEVVIEDWRVAALLHRWTEAEDELERIKSFKRPAKQPPKQTRSRRKQPSASKVERLTQRAKATGKQSDQIAAVSALLSNRKS